MSRSFGKQAVNSPQVATWSRRRMHVLMVRCMVGLLSLLKDNLAILNMTKKYLNRRNKLKLIRLAKVDALALDELISSYSFLSIDSNISNAESHRVAPSCFSETVRSKWQADFRE